MTDEDFASSSAAADAGPGGHLSLAAHATLIVGAAIGMACGFAILFTGSFGMFLKPIGASFGWDRPAVSLILTMGYLGYALGSPVVGMLYDKAGIALVQAISIVVFAAGLASLAVLPPSLPAFMVSGLVIGLAGTATAPTGYVLILAKLIRRRLGLSVGLAMIGLGLGLSLAPGLSLQLINMLNWRQAYLALGGLALVGGFAALALIRLSSAAPVAGSSAKVATSETEGMTLGEAVADRRFWILGGTALFISTIGFGILAHLPAALSDRGVAPGSVAGIAGFMGIGILVGRVGAAIAMDRFFAPAIGLVCYMIGAAGLYGLAVLPAEGLALLRLSAFAAGMLTGSEGDVMPFLTRHYFGLRRFGAIFGCVTGLAGLGGLIGPVLFGTVFERSGSYDPVLFGGGAACIFSGFLLLAMGRYRYTFKAGALSRQTT